MFLGIHKSTFFNDLFSSCCFLLDKSLSISLSFFFFSPLIPVLLQAVHWGGLHAVVSQRRGPRGRSRARGGVCAIHLRMVFWIMVDRLLTFACSCCCCGCLLGCFLLLLLPFLVVALRSTCADICLMFPQDQFTRCTTLPSFVLPLSLLPSFMHHVFWSSPWFTHHHASLFYHYHSPPFSFFFPCTHLLAPGRPKFRGNGGASDCVAGPSVCRDLVLDFYGLHQPVARLLRPVAWIIVSDAQ